MNLIAFHNISQVLPGFVGNTSPSGPITKFTSFRSSATPQTPPVKVNTPVPVGSGRYRDVANFSNWMSAIAAAQPGDVIRITNSIPNPLTVRGNKWGIPGATLQGSGASGGRSDAPITIYCVPDAFIDPNNTLNDQAALTVANANYIDLVSVNVRNSQRGIVLENVHGTTDARSYVSSCRALNIGEEGIQVRGSLQSVASQGGTPEAGDGNEDGYCSFVVVEYSDLTDCATGLQLGRPTGSAGANGWYARAEDTQVRGNNVAGSSVNGVEAAPGCLRTQLLHNVVFAGATDDGSGAALKLLYMDSAMDAKPTWANVDPELYVEHNRVYDLNLSKIQSPSGDVLMIIGHSGIRTANNIFWAYPDGTTPFNPAVVLRTAKVASEFGTFDSWLYNNLYWGRGFLNEGSDYPPGTPITLGAWWTDLNNVTPVGYGGGQHTAAVAGTDFEGIVELPGEIDTAEWETYGAGSSFDLKDTSALDGAGTAFTSSDLWLDQCISQRTIPSVSPNAGPFQPY